MFKSPYLRELEALYHEADRLAWTANGKFCWQRFHAVTRLGLGLSTAQKQQHRDATLLVLFAFAYEGFPDSPTLKILAPDPPDFVLECDGQRIAIEITEIYASFSRCARPQGQEPLKERMVDEASRIYRANGKPPISAAFSFNNETNYLKRDLSRLAPALEACIPTHLAASEELVPVHACEYGPNWVPGLDMILVRKPRSYESPEHLWRIQFSGFVHASETFIQQTLDAKELKVPSYRKANCNNYWLVVVVMGTAPSSFLDEPNPKYIFKSSFDQVFVFFVQSKRVVAIACDRPA
jgi:hypothetical protein